MRRYQRQRLRIPLRLQPWGCLVLMLLVAAGCRTAPVVDANGCTVEGTATQAGAGTPLAGANAGGPGCFWNLCHRKRVPELGPTLSPFLPVPTYDVFSGMPVGVKPVAVAVPGTLPSALPSAPQAQAPGSPPQAVVPPADPRQDREAQRSRPAPVQLASSSETVEESPAESGEGARDNSGVEPRPAESADQLPVTTSGPSTLRIRKESLRAESATPAAADR